MAVLPFIDTIGMFYIGNLWKFNMDPQNDGLERMVTHSWYDMRYNPMKSDGVKRDSDMI